MTATYYGTSVIICAYTEERWNDLVAAVESLRKQTHLPREIIIVVDHNPALFERIQRHIPDVTVVENTASRGLSGARNTGLALARGEYIAFLDDDAEAEPDWLELLVHHCADPQVLGVGGMVVPRWLEKQPAWFPPEFYWVVGCTYLANPDQATVTRNPYGGCTCIKRSVFEAIGGFRENIGRIGVNQMGGEETELSIRATQHWPQKVFLYEPRARIYHRIPARRASWRYFLSRCYAEGLSKAQISTYVGTKDGLSSERAYLFQTLPRAIIRNLTHAIFRRDPAGFSRAGAIITGALVTATGYLKRRVALWLTSPRLSKHRQSQQNMPAKRSEAKQAQVY